MTFIFKYRSRGINLHESLVLCNSPSSSYFPELLEAEGIIPMGRPDVNEENLEEPRVNGELSHMEDDVIVLDAHIDEEQREGSPRTRIKTDPVSELSYENDVIVLDDDVPAETANNGTTAHVKEEPAEEGPRKRIKTDPDSVSMSKEDYKKLIEGNKKLMEELEELRARVGRVEQGSSSTQGSSSSSNVIVID